jgi:hypothetical protein
MNVGLVYLAIPSFAGKMEKWRNEKSRYKIDIKLPGILLFQPNDLAVSFGHRLKPPSWKMDFCVLQPLLIFLVLYTNKTLQRIGRRI